MTWICSLFLISNIPFLFRKTATQSDDLPPVSKAHVLGVGLVAGLVSGITGAVGLLLNRFYLRSGLEKEEIVATRAANEILLHLVKLVIYFQLGLFSANSICIGAVVAVAALFSAPLMKWLLPYLREGAFRRVGYSAMACSGAFLLVQTSNTIVTQRNPGVQLVSVTDGV